MDHHLSQLKSLLDDPSGAITPTSDPARYAASTKPWSRVHDRHPKLVLEPRSEAELERIIRYLVNDAPDELDFAVRGTGVGNSSAADVIVSLSAFKSIGWCDESQKTLELGAGLVLGDVDAWLDEHAPEYAIIGSRCPFVGITGSTLMGGLSWLSSSHGLGSDPSNLLDVRVTLGSGGSMWASEHSDTSLLWALRGGGGNFGAVTALRVQAHRVSRRNWSGLIRYRDSSAAVDAISRRLAAFASRDRTDGLACHVFVVDFGARALHGGAPTPDLVVLPFDPLGEEHARSQDGFAWALEDVPGGVDDSLAAEMPLSAVHNAQSGQAATHGLLDSWMAAALVGSSMTDTTTVNVDGKKVKATAIDSHTVRGAWDWYVSLTRNPTTQRFAQGAFALVEVMQAPTLLSAGSPAATAWPHHALGRQNVLQLGVGCVPADDSAQRAGDHEMAMRILRDAPATIVGAGAVQPADHFLPNFIQPDIHDVPAIFGQNWQRLREAKTRYDPRGRFNKGFFVPPL